MAGNNGFMQMRLSWILPIVQLPLAIVMLEWGRHSGMQSRFDTLYFPTPALLCRGINAPATVLMAIAFFFDRVDHDRPTILGATLDYPLFLIGVVVLWYLVGRALDSRRFADKSPLAWTWPRLVLVGGPLALLGALFLYEGVQGLFTPWRWNNYWGNIAESVLTTLWSFVLIGTPALKLAQRFRAPK